MFKLLARSLLYLKALLNSSANVDAVDEDGWTPLHYAARDGLKEIATVSNEPSSPPCELNLMFQALLDGKANVNLIDEDGMTPLHYAALYDHDELSKVNSIRCVIALA